MRFHCTKVLIDISKEKLKKSGLFPQFFASQQPNNNKDYGNHEQYMYKALTPRKAKKPTNQSIKTITTIINQALKEYFSTKL